MRRCIIHIGHPKTASTYLQHCLHLNPALFASHKYWLPSHFHDFGFYDLGPLSEQGVVISGNLAPLHEVMAAGPAEKLAAMHEYLFSAPGDHDVLLSCELFFYYVRALISVVKTAASYGLKPELVAYLPRQDRAAVTAYLQNVRYHEYSQGVIDFLVHDRNMPYCNYLSVFARIRAALPDLTITLRSFHRNFLRDGDILADFLATIGSSIDPATCRRPERTSNQGLHLEHYELLRVAAILGWSHATERLRPIEEPLSDEDRARLHAFYYRPGVAAFLTEHYLADNQTLLTEFMPGASDAERHHWAYFDPAPPPIHPNPTTLADLGDWAFNG